MKVILVLTGGGVRGAFQGGVLYELMNNVDIEIEKIYASSIGAILAPLVINKKRELLKDIILSCKSLQQYTEKWPWWKGGTTLLSVFLRLGLYKRQTLTDKIWKSLSQKERAIANEKCNIVAWDVCKRSNRWFGDHEDPDDLLQGIEASCALWMFTPPVKIQGNYYVDGGACYFLPIEKLLGKERPKTTILVVNTRVPHRESSNPRKPSNILELMYDIHDASVNTTCDIQMNILKGLYRDQVIVVSPEEDIFSSSLDINPNKIEKSFEMGRSKSKEMFKKLNVQ